MAISRPTQALDKGVSESNRRASKELDRQLLNLPWLQGAEIRRISLIVGINKINHPLRRAYRGRLITKNSDSIATLYDDPTNDSPEKQIWLNFAGTAGTEIDIWVY